MAALNFLDSLNEEQLDYARKIGEKAKEMGIPPKLAVAIAYHESRLNPNAPRGADGEFGGMQVMPKTGKGLGYTNKDLADPDKNIEAGLKYLKQNLDAFGGDPKLATIGYNAGTDASFFSGGDLPKVTESYIKAMNGYGAYSDVAQPASIEVATDVDPADAAKEDAEREARLQASIDEQEKRQAQILGAGVGAGIAGTKAVGSGAGAVLQAGANRVGQGFKAGMQGNIPAATSMPPAGSPTVAGAPSQSIMRQPIPSGGPDGGRMAAGQTGTMPYNYGKAAGLTDIEAGRALDMTKEAGGVHDLASQRRDAMNRLKTMGMGNFAENPMYGGIMTEAPSAGGGPRESFTMKAPVAPSPDLPQGQVGGLSQLPPRQPIPTMPKPPSGLDSVTSMFKGMMRPMSSAASAVGKYVFPPLALASAAGEGVNIAQQARKPEGQRDVTGMALSGANILGSGMSMFPATAPVGVPLALGTAAAQAYRDNPEYMRKKMQGLSGMPLLDDMTGALP